jgi:predicted nucleic acid-binding protein
MKSRLTVCVQRQRRPRRGGNPTPIVQPSDRDGAAHTVRKTVDCLIATLCLLQGHRLLHNDRDFDPFETVLGREVVRP